LDLPEPTKMAGGIPESPAYLSQKFKPRFV